VLASRRLASGASSSLRCELMWRLVVLVGVVGVELAGRTGNAAGEAFEPPLQSAARALGSDQGVYAEAQDGSVLAAQAADRPVHPASVNKIASSLAVLQRLGPGHRFQTNLLADGPLLDGQLSGNLVVEGGGDPSLVYENAFLMLRRLRVLGVRAVAGGLVVHGPFVFNWHPDPDGSRLRLALSGRDGAPAWTSLERLVPWNGPRRLDDAAIGFRGRPVLDGAASRILVHRSPPLVRILKWLNDYSNNVFQLLAAQIGGPTVVEAVARANLPAGLRGEIAIADATGEHPADRMSPRAAVGLLRALDVELTRRGLSFVDIFPVSGIDRGTLEERLLDHRGMIVGKTGTFPSYGASALVGIASTRRWGMVTFAILNSWIPVPEARRRQDAFVRALLDGGGAVPWTYHPVASPPFTDARLD
jgi:D-alanyl-D-alanine carboxypeptidase/D-alanyl-D-alanine-endopeptidase (penicillin-binding protein 4)